MRPIFLGFLSPQSLIAGCDQKRVMLRFTSDSRFNLRPFAEVDFSISLMGESQTWL